VVAWGMAGGVGAGGTGCLTVWLVVAEAGPAAPCALCGGCSLLGGKGPPCADLVQVGGHEEQCGEQCAGGDAADAPAGGLGEGFVGWVFHEPVEAFDGVAEGGVTLCPGFRPEGEFLAVAGADVWGDGDGALAAEPGRVLGGLEYFHPSVTRGEGGFAQRADEPGMVSGGGAGEPLVAVGVGAVFAFEPVGGPGGDAGLAGGLVEVPGSQVCCR
jgi:hypothetical protein